MYVRNSTVNCFLSLQRKPVPRSMLVLKLAQIGTEVQMVCDRGLLKQRRCDSLYGLLFVCSKLILSAKLCRRK